MKPIVKVEGKTGTILLIGQFDFNVHKDFRAASQELLENAEVSNIDVNFEQVPYLDSSALGMLLLLRDYAGGEKAQVEVINSNNDVRKILAISNFDKLFAIS